MTNWIRSFYVYPEFFFVLWQEGPRIEFFISPFKNFDPRKIRRSEWGAPKAVLENATSIGIWNWLIEEVKIGQTKYKDDCCFKLYERLHNLEWTQADPLEN